MPSDAYQLFCDITNITLLLNLLLNLLIVPRRLLCLYSLHTSAPIADGAERSPGGNHARACYPFRCTCTRAIHSDAHARVLSIQMHMHACQQAKYDGQFPCTDACMHASYPTILLNLLILPRRLLLHLLAYTNNQSRWRMRPAR